MRIIVRPPHIAALLAHGVATVVTWEHDPGLTPGERVLFAADPITDYDPRGGGEMVIDPGHIVGSGTVEAVVPIVRSPDDHDLAESDERCVYLWHHDQQLGFWRPYGKEPWPSLMSCATITDQLPFATFTPGWMAAIITDAKPTSDRCPACCRISSARTSGCPPIPWTGTDLDEWAP